MDYEPDINGDGMVSRAEADLDVLFRNLFTEDGNFNSIKANQAKNMIRSGASTATVGVSDFTIKFKEQYALTPLEVKTVYNAFELMRDQHKENLNKQGGIELVTEFMDIYRNSEQGQKDAMVESAKANIARMDAADLEAALSEVGNVVDPQKSFRDHLGATKKRRKRSGTLASKRNYAGGDLRGGLRSQESVDASRIPKPESPREPPKKVEPGSRGFADYAGMSLGLKTPARSGPHSKSYYGPNDFVAASFYGGGVLVDRNRDGKITPEERAEAKSIADSGALDPITFEYDKKEMLNKSLKRQQTLKLDPKTYNIGGILVDANGDGIVSLIEEDEARKQALQNNIANVVASREQDKAEKSLYGGMTREDAVRRFGEDLVLEREQAALEGPLGDYYAPTIKAATEGGIDPETEETIPRDRSASFGGSAYDIPQGANTPSQSPSQISSPTATMTFQSAVQNAPEGGGRVPSGINVAPRPRAFDPSIGATDIPSPTPAGTQLAALNRGGAGGGAGTQIGGSSNIPLSSGQFVSVRREMQTLPQWRTVVG